MVTRHGTHCLGPICYLTASTHYNSGALIPECNGLSQFKEDTVPVREINLIAYLPLVQPTQKLCYDLDLNPGNSRSSASKAQQVVWLRKRISPLSHGDIGLKSYKFIVIVWSRRCRRYLCAGVADKQFSKTTYRRRVCS